MGVRHNMCSRSKRIAARLLWEIQGGRCAYCDGRVPHPDEVRGRLRAASGAGRPNDPSLEHVVPRGRGGSNAQTNLLLAHYRCNYGRGDADLPEAARRVWKANQIAIAVLRGQREAPKVCGACESPYTCEADQRCAAFQSEAA